MSLEKTLNSVKVTITKDIATGNITAVSRGAYRTPYFESTDHAQISPDDVSSILDAVISKTKEEMTKDGSTVVDAVLPEEE